MQAGKHGTKKFVAQYGDRLVCVRYRKDTENQRQLTTVELIVDERPLKTKAPNISPETMVLLRIDYGEINEGIAVRAAGGIWDGERKLWRIAYQQVEQLGMLDRIVPAIPEERV
jgi:hypothetical protein